MSWRFFFSPPVKCFLQEKMRLDQNLTYLSEGAHQYSEVFFQRKTYEFKGGDTYVFWNFKFAIFLLLFLCY